MSKCVLTLLLVFAFCAVGCRRSPEWYLQKGKRQMEAHKYLDASLNYRTAIQRDPQFGEAYYQLALAEFGMNNPAAGYRNLQRAAELLPGRIDVAVKLADVSLAAYMGDSRRPRQMYDTVDRIANQLIAADPKSFDGLRFKAYLALLDKKFSEAEQLFRTANEVKPLQPETVLGWAEALFQNQQPARAETVALQLIEHDKSYKPIYDLLYRHYAAGGQLAEAEQILVRKAVNNPGDTQSALELAGFYAARHNEAAMKSALGRLLEDEKTFPAAHLNVGDFYSRIQRWDEALQQYKEGIQSQPRDNLVYLKRTAEVWLAQGKGEQAGQVVDQILKRDPNDQGAMAVKASLLLASGKPAAVSQAITQFRQLVQKSPDNPVWLYNLGRALAADGNAVDARRSFEDAIKKRPDFLSPRFGLADLSLATGDYASALRYADEMLGINANAPAVHRLRAVSLINLGRDAEARRELATIEKVLPDEVQLQLANADFKEKNFQQAEDRLQKLLQKRPGDPRVLTGLVQVYVGQGRIEAADSFLEKELKKSPGSPAAQQLRAEVETRLGNYDAAIGHYEQLLAATPDSAKLYLALGNTYKLKGDLTNAISNFEKAGSLAPRDPAPPTLMGEAQMDSGENQPAILSFRRAFQLNPDSVILMNNLAYLIVESGGNIDEALALAQKASRMAPQQPNVADTLGWVYLKKHWNDQALNIFRDLVQKFPANPTFHYHLGMALMQSGDKVTAKAEWNSGLSRKPSSELRRSIESALARAE